MRNVKEFTYCSPVYSSTFRVFRKLEDHKYSAEEVTPRKTEQTLLFIGIRNMSATCFSQAESNAEVVIIESLKNDVDGFFKICIKSRVGSRISEIKGYCLPVRLATGN